MPRKIVKRTPKCLQKIAQEKFQGRLTCLMKKAHEIGVLCESDVYVVLYRHGRYYTYKSKDSPTWPPSDQQMVSPGRRHLLEMLIVTEPEQQQKR